MGIVLLQMMKDWRNISENLPNKR